MVNESDEATRTRNHPNQARNYLTVMKRSMNSIWTRMKTSDFEHVRTSDPRLRRYVQLFYRFLGLIVCAFIEYLTIFQVFKDKATQVHWWVIGYVLFLIIIEGIRIFRPGSFDSMLFRGLRIFVNMLAFAWLIFISPENVHLLALLFLIPIFAAIVYFPDLKWLGWSILGSVILGLMLITFYIDTTVSLAIAQFLLISTVLSVATYAFKWVYQNVLFGPDILGLFSHQLSKTLDLQYLIAKILDASLTWSRASRSLIIIVDPFHKTYISHGSRGLELRDGFTINDVVRKCSVLGSGKPFYCPNIEEQFKTKNFYSHFFNCNPQSVIAVPLFSNEGEVFGVLSVIDDKPDQFDSTAIDLIQSFSHLVSNAVHNCLIYRQMKLRETGGRMVSQRLIGAKTETQVVSAMITEAKIMVPQAERYVMFVFQPNKQSFQPTYALHGDNTIPRAWTNLQQNDIGVDKDFIRPLIELSLLRKEPVVINDISSYPNEKVDPAQNEVKSLIVAPLIDMENSEWIGALCVYSDRIGVYSSDDELNLHAITAQAAQKITSIRAFTRWRNHGGVLRQILDVVRGFNLDVGEDELYEQITRSAATVLGFKIARIRILDPETQMLITRAITGIPDYDAPDVLGAKLPMSVLDPFLTPKFKYEHSYWLPHDNQDWKLVADEYFYVAPKTRRKRAGWRSHDALLTPLVNQSNRKIGILSLDIPETGSFPTQHQLEAIGVFVDAVSWIIELAHAQRRIKEQRERTNAFIATISAELARGQDFKAIGEVVVQIGTQLLEAEGCNLFIIRNDNRIELTHSTFLPPATYIGRRKPVTRNKGCGLTSWVAFTGEDLCFNDDSYKEHEAWAKDKEHLQYLPSKTCNSLLIVPVKDRNGVVVGVITLQNKLGSDGSTCFDSNDKERLSHLARELSLALEKIAYFNTITEWERIGVEDDLHFLINWHHSGVVCWVDAMNEWMQQGNFEKAKELMPELLQHTHTTIGELKSIHTNIVSKALDSKTLDLAFRRLIEGFQRRTTPFYDEDMEIQLTCPKNVELPASIGNVLVRIASEALANAINHSGILRDPAVHVHVKFERKRKKLLLSISDTGKGIITKIEGYGITRMRELTAKLNALKGIGANLNIDTAAGKGTTISVVVNMLDHLDSNK